MTSCSRSAARNVKEARQASVPTTSTYEKTPSSAVGKTIFRRSGNTNNQHVLEGTTAFCSDPINSGTISPLEYVGVFSVAPCQSKIASDVAGCIRQQLNGSTVVLEFGLYRRSVCCRGLSCLSSPASSVSAQHADQSNKSAAVTAATARTFTAVIVATRSEQSEPRSA